MYLLGAKYEKKFLIFFIIYPVILLANIDDNLIEAARTGNKLEVEYLIKNGANVNYINPYGTTALIASSAWGHIEIVKILINNKAGLDYEDNISNGTALMYANVKGYKDVATILKSAGAGKNDNLIRASRNGDLDRVKIILSSGYYDIDEIDRNGYTALIGSIPSGNIELIQLLLKNGADPNIAIEQNMHTALISSSIIGNIEAVKSLLAAGAYIDAKNINGETALYSASFNGHIKIVRLLLEKGANPNIATNSGNTSLGDNSKAAENNNYYKAIRILLKKYGAKE